LAIAAVAGTYWAISRLNQPVEHEAAGKIITIQPGSSPGSIIGRLTDAGVVRYPSILKVYLRLARRANNLKAGDYEFESPISPLQAIGKIERGEVYSQRVTIPEGLNRFEIAELLANKTNKATSGRFLELMEKTDLISTIDHHARSLEGYLFPDTYNYTTASTPEDIVKAMIDRFGEVFSPEWSTRAAQKGLSIRDVVTLASIVEEEARVPDERPLVASVFMNRLKIGMPLASDPTFIYAAILANDYDGNPNEPRHRRRLSRYNTYLYAGLPPGPIASPGRASIEAALYPHDTDYLYFVVSGTSGRHKFSRTSAEHEVAVEAYHRLRDEQRKQQ
jgi:UPF0755 protein